jgi:hypothetical protein
MFPVSDPDPLIEALVLAATTVNPSLSVRPADSPVSSVVSSRVVVVLLVVIVGKSVDVVVEVDDVDVVEVVVVTPPLRSIVSSQPLRSLPIVPSNMKSRTDFGAVRQSVIEREYSS